MFQLSKVRVLIVPLASDQKFVQKIIQKLEKRALLHHSEISVPGNRFWSETSHLEFQFSNETDLFESISDLQMFRKTFVIIGIISNSVTNSQSLYQEFTEFCSKRNPVYQTCLCFTEQSFDHSDILNVHMNDTWEVSFINSVGIKILEHFQLLAALNEKKTSIPTPLLSEIYNGSQLEEAPMIEEPASFAISFLPDRQKKKTTARNSKLLGDMYLLSGQPTIAYTIYNQTVETMKSVGEGVWLACASEACIYSSLLSQIQSEMQSQNHCLWEELIVNSTSSTVKSALAIVPEKMRDTLSLLDKTTPIQEESYLFTFLKMDIPLRFAEFLNNFIFTTCFQNGCALLFPVEPPRLIPTEGLAGVSSILNTQGGQKMATKSDVGSWLMKAWSQDVVSLKPIHQFLLLKSLATQFDRLEFQRKGVFFYRQLYYLLPFLLKQTHQDYAVLYEQVANPSYLTQFKDLSNFMKENLSKTTCLQNEISDISLSLLVTACNAMEDSAVDGNTQLKVQLLFELLRLACMLGDNEKILHSCHKLLSVYRHSLSDEEKMDLLDMIHVMGIKQEHFPSSPVEIRLEPGQKHLGIFQDIDIVTESGYPVVHKAATLEELIKLTTPAKAKSSIVCHEPFSVQIRLKNPFDTDIELYLELCHKQGDAISHSVQMELIKGITQQTTVKCIPQSQGGLCIYGVLLRLSNNVLGETHLYNDQGRSLERKLTVLPPVGLLSIHCQNEDGLKGLVENERFTLTFTLKNIGNIPISHLYLYYVEKTHTTNASDDPVFYEEQMYENDIYLRNIPFVTKISQSLKFGPLLSKEKTDNLLANELEVNSWIELDIEIQGKCQTKEITFYFQYSQVRQNEPIFYREQAISLKPHVTPAFEVANAMVLPTQNGGLYRMDQSNFESVEELTMNLPILDQAVEYALLLIDARSRCNQLLQISVNFTNENRYSTVLYPKTRKRLLIPVKRFCLEESVTNQPIPRPEWKQFVRQKTNLAERDAAFRRKAFWYRKSIIEGHSEPPKLSLHWEASGSKRGIAPLREIKFCYDDLLELEKSPIDVNLFSVETKNSIPTKETVDIETIYSYSVKVTGKGSSVVLWKMDGQDYLSDGPKQKAFHDSVDFELGFCYLSKGLYALNFCINTVEGLFWKEFQFLCE